MPVFERPYLKKKFHPALVGGTAQYLGFTLMSPWESALSSLNPKYWVAGYQANRYGLEKIGMTGLLHSYGKAYEL
jgi:hypothetical protein